VQINQESQLVPYGVSPLPEGPWIIFAPHADDETFGMGGSLLLAAAQKIPITLIVLTDGQLGGANADGLLAQTRAAEARSVVKTLGNVDIQFWDQPDRQLSATDALIGRVTNLLKRGACSSLFFPAPTEYHPDHRVTTQLVWEGQRRAGFEGRCIAYDISAQGPVNLMIDTTKVVEE